MSAHDGYIHNSIFPSFLPSHCIIGAFVPGNFGNIYTSLNNPAVKGFLHFAGEAISVRHAWVKGTLDNLKSCERLGNALFLCIPEAYDEILQELGAHLQSGLNEQVSFQAAIFLTGIDLVLGTLRSLIPISFLLNKMNRRLQV